MQRGRGRHECNWFPSLPQETLWQALLASQFLLQALRYFLPLLLHMAMMCISQVCLERDVCILFQRGIPANWSWSAWWYGAQEFAYVRESTVERCVGIDGHPFMPGGKKHEGRCCLCAKGSRVNCMPWLLLNTWCFHGKWDGRWRNQKIGRRRLWCLLQTLCPLGAHSSSGGIWGHSRGGMPYFLND